MLVFLNVLTLAQPEVYIGGAGQLFDAEGKMTNEGTRKFLKGFVEAFGAWVDTVSKG
jgi:chromate reductase